MRVSENPSQLPSQGEQLKLPPIYTTNTKKISVRKTIQTWTRTELRGRGELQRMLDSIDGIPTAWLAKSSLQRTTQTPTSGIKLPPLE